MWSTLPIIGGASFCASTVTGTGSLGGITGQGQGSTGSICGQTVPAGPPALTGVEMIPADTQLTGGAPPQSATVPSALLGALNSKVNRLIGGDFGTNLWQRGTTPISATTATTATMTADRWWAYSSANTMTISKQTGAADTIPTLGLYASMRVDRPSGTDVTPICVGQTLDKQAAAPLIGNNAIFSFYALAGSTFSPTASGLTVKVAYFTAADSAASQGTIQFAGGNSQTAALGTTTGYTAAVGGVSPGTTGTVASGVATVPISTTWTRYAVYAPIPTVNASGTAVTGVTVSLCETNVGTGASTDWFEFTGAQVQAMPSTATAVLANGVISPTGFERRLAADEQFLQQAYSYVVVESAAALNIQGACAGSTTSIANCLIAFPAPMRIAPVAKYTAGFEACTTTACSSATVCTALTTSATQAWAVSNKQAVVDCASSAGTPAAGTAFFLYDIGTGSATGVMSFSAEP
jgi:hypothetical protein